MGHIESILNKGWEALFLEPGDSGLVETMKTLDLLSYIAFLLFVLIIVKGT